jgi:hypothetical protein
MGCQNTLGHPRSVKLPFQHTEKRAAVNCRPQEILGLNGSRAQIALPVKEVRAFM